MMPLAITDFIGAWIVVTILSIMVILVFGQMIADYVFRTKAISKSAEEVRTILLRMEAKQDRIEAMFDRRLPDARQSTDDAT